MSERAAYSRVYWSVIDDPKFTNVYDDDRALATWLRLLLVADQSWPASAHIPTGTNAKALTILAEAGLIDVGTGRRYRIHGLDAERNRRKEAATRLGGKGDPTGTQQGPNRDPEPPRTTGLRRDETRRDEERRDNAPATTTVEEAPEFRAVQWLVGRHCYLPETGGYYRWLLRLMSLASDDVEEVLLAFGKASRLGVKDGDIKGFLTTAEELIRKKPDINALEREERAEDAAAAFNRGVERTQRELARMRGETA